MTLTLRKALADEHALLDLIYERGGEIEEILEGWMKEIRENQADRVDASKFAITVFEDRAALNRSRAREYTDAARLLENVAERIKDRIKYTMQEAGVDQVTGNDWRFKLSKTKASLKIDETELPNEWKIVVTRMDPDKERIRAALEQGEFIPGASLEEGKALRVYLNKGDRS